VRGLAAEHDVDPSAIEGTGENGRVTAADVLATVDASSREAPVHESAPRPTGDEIVPFSAVRKRTAEHMIRSKATSAHAAVVTEVDYEGVDRVRSVTRLSYLPFIARAVVDAITDFPNVNAAVQDDALVVRADVHLGIAVDLGERGLIVPVVHDARAKRMRALAAEIRALATRARDKKLSPDDVAGGTFTITNPGPFGTYMSVPIINQPQVAILATDSVAMQPVVVETAEGDSIAMHPIGNLTLTFDHRVIDGGYAAAFLARVRDILQTRPWDVEL